MTRPFTESDVEQAALRRLQARRWQIACRLPKARLSRGTSQHKNRKC